MKAHEFTPITAANTYKINGKGEILNSKGFPVTANEAGIVKLTDNDGKRKNFKVSDLVAAIKTGNAVEEVAPVEQPDIPDFLKEAAPAPAPVAAEPEAAKAPVKPKKEAKEKTAAKATEPVAEGTETATAPEKKKRRMITLADVADIKAKFAAGAKRKELAIEYGIGYTYVVHLLLDDIVPKK